VFLATCPKSNSTLTTYSKARAAVLEKGPLPVPLKLRNAPTPLMKSMGYSGGYRYPHNFEGNYVPEEYLPDELRGEKFYEPSESGEESQIRERLTKWREELERKRAETAAQQSAEAAAARKLRNE
jgi:putative ATPase